MPREQEPQGDFGGRAFVDAVIQNTHQAGPDLAPLHFYRGQLGRYLGWLLNPTREAQQTTIVLDTGQPAFGKAFWGNASAADGVVTIPPRDVIVVQLT